MHHLTSCFYLHFNPPLNTSPLLTGVKSSKDIIDEDELIAANPSEVLIDGKDNVDRLAPKPTRKPCKNCKCGLANRKNIIETPKPTPQPIVNTLIKENLNTSQPINTLDLGRSSCGKCYMGDSFRCAKCPYNGFPAFEQGEKIQLPSQLFEDDI